ncbi:MAG: hypothetical protein RLZZ210_454 [Pseudomonadota bacterium]|jgi:chromosomal replication initiator protein
MNNQLPPVSEHINNDETCQQFWNQVLSTLEKELPIQQFKTWVTPLKCFGLDAERNKVLIVAPNRFKLDFAKKQFAGIIYDIAQKFWANSGLDFSLYNPSAIHTHSAFKKSVNMGIESDTDTNLDINSNQNNNFHANSSTAVTKSKKTSKSDLNNNFINLDNLDIFDEIAKNSTTDKTSTSVKSVNNSENIDKSDKNEHDFFGFENIQLNIKSNGGSAKGRASASSLYEQTRLNKMLNFETFIEGQANMLARSAAMQVATHPQRAYNPCFFYGGVGLGKTHLMHAIGNNFYKTHKSKVKYIHAEQFVSDVVKAYQRKSYDDLKSSYHNLDLLLIDDIQFLAGKTRTQEEFFYVFESLISKQAQIVITSDTYPRDLKDIDDRLISRFNSGLLVAIEPPEIEMRIKILQNKAKQDKFKLSDEVAFFVAKNLASNIRELEGALRKLMAYNMFHKVNIDIEIAKIALKDILPETNPVANLTIEYIQKIVAIFYGINVADMSSRKRTANVTKPRQIAMFFAKELTAKSLPEIGVMFGGRDHSTILHAIRKVKKDMQALPELAHEIKSISQSFNT